MQSGRKEQGSWQQVATGEENQEEDTGRKHQERGRSWHYQHYSTKILNRAQSQPSALAACVILTQSLGEKSHSIDKLKNFIREVKPTSS